ncbi:MAG TPA: MFS transporter [Stellaceae bacterium]|jgi:MHS family citrate/tricarballylate:H+ symporter-like MFS transporter|nr:MFS transporter [Stellaceae bacterium]
MGEGAASGRLGMVIRATSGNFLEMFDFFLMGIYATHIARTFFPLSNDYASLMLTFGTFGAAFLVRPVGALVLGPYIDRVGRRRGLSLTLGIMGMGTVLVAFVPGYATIGLAAPMLVFLGRILQGFSTGVELCGVAVYLAEIAPPSRRGFFAAWQPASQQIAIILAALLGFLLNAALEPSQMAAWGWRVPFFFGCLIIPCVFVIRRTLKESDAFLAQRVHPTLPEIYRSIAAHWTLVLAGMLLVVMTTVSFYMIAVYTPTFAKSVLKLTASDSLLITICIALSNLFWLPVMGLLSDRIGRAPILVTMLVLMALTAYPALYWLVAAPSFDRMLGVELWFSFLYGSYNGAMVVALAEIMPVSVRTSGFSLAYSLATTAGGFTAAISTLLIHTFNDKAAPGYWLCFAALCGLVATFMIYGRGRQWLVQRSHASLSELEHDHGNQRRLRKVGERY